MKSRKEIKSLAKQGLRSSYWPSVLTLVLFALIFSASSFTGIIFILLAGPLTAGRSAFFLKAQKGEKAGVGTMFTEGVGTNFGRKVGGYWLHTLFLCLWSMLFAIPGIIKYYAYSMHFYILADCPNVTARQSLKLSMRMMKGNKWKLFVLDLSFIGWAILSAFTGGLLTLFYVAPYMSHATARFYLEVKEKALATGVITAEELGL